MSLSLSILASGSAGNCGVVRCDSRLMLIDCGIGPRTTAARMRPLGVGLDAIGAICLTHLDRDHFNPNWVGEIVRRKIFVYCHRNRVDELAGAADDSAFTELIRPFDGQTFCPLEGVRAASIALPHDELGSHGFVLESSGGRIGYATDLGRVDSELVGGFCGVDVLAIESNYDAQMQRDSSRPWFLKQRIMGGRGHLSNEQAFGAVRKMLDRCQKLGRALPGHIVLLHRSRQCNCPRLVRELFSGDVRVAPRLVLAEQDRATQWLAAGSRRVFSGEQLELQWA